MTKDEVGSVDGFRGDTKKQHLFGVRIWRGRGAVFEVEGIRI